VWVSKTVDGTLSDAANPAVSADGRFVAFESAFGHLVPEPDENAGAADIYLRDLVEGVTTRVDVSTAGVQANNVCQFPRLSGDGRYVACVSYANNSSPATRPAATPSMPSCTTISPARRR
jgi:Tol biopolymer transport system component